MKCESGVLRQFGAMSNVDCFARVPKRCDGDTSSVDDACTNSGI